MSSLYFRVVILVGLQFILLHAAPSSAADPRQSGYHSMSAENKAMQDDPSLNPATFAILDGQSAWQEKLGSSNQACASCHGDAAKSMQGVATRYPQLVDGKLMNLEGRINQCRAEKQKVKPLPYESKELLSLLAYISVQSKGMPIQIKVTPATQPYLEAGKRHFNQRIGQLNLSCKQCHEERAGEKLAGIPIPQAHPTAYPIYRIEWQSVGSLQRRLRNCMIGVRAEPYAYGSKELTELELFLMMRANGMPLEAPGVRP